MYDLFIDCVNGDFIRLQSQDDTDRNRVLKFLEQQDHEGSSISLHLINSDQLDVFFGEEVYAHLRA